jgi:hypothetical protein
MNAPIVFRTAYEAMGIVRKRITTDGLLESPLLLQQ